MLHVKTAPCVQSKPHQGKRYFMARPGVRGSLESLQSYLEMQHIGMVLPFRACRAVYAEASSGCTHCPWPFVFGPC